MQSIKTIGGFTAALLLALASAALVYVLFVPFATYFALFFCAVLLATALDALAGLLNVHGRLPRSAAVALVITLILAALAAFAWWMGPELLQQFEALRKEVREGLTAAYNRLESTALGGQLLSTVPPVEQWSFGSGGLVEDVGSAVSASLATLTNLLIVLVLGLFFVASPGVYLHGPVRLLPPRHRERGVDILTSIGKALRRWLVARAILMVVVAVLFGAGLLLLGVQLALPLALLAGALSFVPFIGPALAFIPSFAVALLQSPAQALYVSALYLGIQVVESYLVEPMVVGRAVSLPPALIIIAQVVSGFVFGAIGVLIATPLLVVLLVLVQTLYLRTFLGDDVKVIGQSSQ